MGSVDSSLFVAFLFFLCVTLMCYKEPLEKDEKIEICLIW